MCANPLNSVVPYYQDDWATIYHGDCLEVLPKLEARASAVVTDPPYNVGFAYGDYVDRKDEGDYIAWLSDVFAWCADRLEPDGALLWFWQGIRVANGEARACLPAGFKIHHLASWFKREFAGDLWKGGHPAYSWEPIVWATREDAEVKYHGPRGGHWGRDCLIGNSSRHNLLAKGHPCPKTEAIVSAVISWVSEPGALILDPFMGSGTTLRAAKDLGRKVIGIEIDESYCEIAVKRLTQEVLGKVDAIDNLATRPVKFDKVWIPPGLRKLKIERGGPMAGSYKHIVNKSGKFQGVELLDNLGDAWEALEECYGMIWYLADGDGDRVEEARQNYKAGLERSPGVVRD